MLKFTNCKRGNAANCSFPGITMSGKKCDYHTALDQLREWCPKDSTVYTIIRSISRTGMQAKISTLIYSQDRFLHPTWSIAVVTGIRTTDKDGYGCLVINGCGFNRGESIVEALAYALYGKENALKHESL